MATHQRGARNDAAMARSAGFFAPRGGGGRVGIFGRGWLALSHEDVSAYIEDVRFFALDKFGIITPDAGGTA